MREMPAAFEFSYKETQDERQAERGKCAALATMRPRCILPFRPAHPRIDSTIYLRHHAAMNILVSGLVNIETTVKVPAFPIQYSPIEFSFFGVHSGVAGVGYNIAKALTVLGDDARLLSFTGSDAQGDAIRAQLAADGIAANHIERSLRSTPESVIFYDDAGRRKIYCDLKDVQEVLLAVPHIKELLEEADIVAACNINFSRPLLKAAKDAGKTIATDVHVLGSVDDEYNRAFLEYADIVFLSDENLPCPREDFLYALKNTYGMEIIVLGCGADGALLYERRTDAIAHFPAAKPERIVNTVGAGDALFSCFVHCHAAGMSAADALQYAELFAAIKISSDGAAQGFVDEAALKAKFAEREGNASW